MIRKNIIIGSLWIFLFTLLGFILEMKLGGGEEWKESVTRHLWKTAHLHGSLFGALNLLYALLISTMKLEGRLISIGSILAIIGALLFPTSLFLGGIVYKIVYIAPFGGMSMVIAWAIMTYALIEKQFNS